jgi:hypothetical protein
MTAEAFRSKAHGWFRATEIAAKQAAAQKLGERPFSGTGAMELARREAMADPAMRRILAGLAER